MPAEKERLVKHIKREYEAKGYSPEEAESIAWGTVTNLEKDKESDGHTDGNEE